MSKTGFCSICRQPKVKVVNEVIAAGGSFPAALERAQDAGFNFSKATFFKHKAHATSTLLTDVPKTNRAVLEAIRDLGMQKALENPDSITVNQALRAASILAEKESKQDHILIVLAKRLQQDSTPEIIEGEFTEMPRLEMQEAT
jgi:hypothetical protein